MNGPDRQSADSHHWWMGEDGRNTSNHVEGDISGQMIQVGHVHGNLTSVHATVVAKTAGSILSKATGQVVNTSPWPNMHEALLELHEILSDWCEAGRRTGEALEHLKSQHLTRIVWTDGPSNAGIGRKVLGIPVRPGYLEMAQRDIEALMAPVAPLTQRWSVTKRRQVARRSLRSLMRVYCPDLLEEFETSVGARADWVKANRDTIDRALKQGIELWDLDRMREEAAATTRQLETVRESLKQLLRERYPMGSFEGRNE